MPLFWCDFLDCQPWLNFWVLYLPNKSCLPCGTRTTVICFAFRQYVHPPCYTERHTNDGLPVTYLRFLLPQQCKTPYLKLQSLYYSDIIQNLFFFPAASSGKHKLHLE